MTARSVPLRNLDDLAPGARVLISEVYSWEDEGEQVVESSLITGPARAEVDDDGTFWSVGDRAVTAGDFRNPDVQIYVMVED